MLYQWSIEKTNLFTNKIGVKAYQQKEIVFEQGDEGNELYIVKSGTLFLEVVIEMIDCNIYPCANKVWEKQVTVRKYVYRARELSAGDFFGHEELVPPEDLNAGSTIYKFRHC